MKKSVLPQEQLQALLKAFKEQHAGEYRLQALGYFGSYARNEAADDSDVDIVFETDDPNLFKTVRMKQDLEKWLGRRVDVVRLRKSMNPRLRGRILREARYV
ncbi:MAG: nucleotidyltransferase family protein [Candidatus Latescibacterota bacterium]